MGQDVQEPADPGWTAEETGNSDIEFTGAFGDGDSSVTGSLGTEPAFDAAFVASDNVEEQPASFNPEGEISVTDEVPESQAADTVDPLPEDVPPAVDTAEPIPEVVQPAADTAEPIPEVVQPAADTAEPIPEVVQPAADPVQPIQEGEQIAADPVLAQSTEELFNGQETPAADLTGSEMEQPMEGVAIVVDPVSAENDLGLEPVSPAEIAEGLFGEEAVTGQPAADLTQEAENEAQDGIQMVSVRESMTAASGFVTDDLVSAGSYYTSADGIVQVTTGGAHTGMYLFGADGMMLTGEQTYNGNGYYLYTKDEAVKDSSAGSSEEKMPYNSTYGQFAVNSWRWVRKEAVWKHYNASGVLETVSQMKKQAGFKGYFTIGANHYALDDNGKPLTGDQVLKDSSGKSHTYYFTPTAGTNGVPGNMFCSGWLKDSTSKGVRLRYFSPEADTLGQMTEHGIAVAKLEGSASMFLIDKDGYLLKNACKKAQDGKYYQTNKKGVVLVNRFGTYKNNKYYYGSDGARVILKNAWHRCEVDNRYYYFGKKSQVVKKTGWQKVTDDGKFVGWFWFAKNGKHKRKTWVSSKTRYLLDSGAMATGFTQIGKKRYYFTPSTEKKANGKMVKNQIIRDGGDIYYAQKNGTLKKSGWVTIKGTTYYFSDYKAVKNQAATYKGVSGWLDGEGIFLKGGWNVVDDYNNLVKYVDPATGKAIKNTSKVIDGYTYYFDSQGYREQDVTDRVSGPYYLECDRVNGVICIYNAAKTIPVKTVRVSVGAPGTETPTGTYTLTAYARWALLMGPTYGQYASLVTGNILIHSVPLATQTIHGVPKSDYALLGTPASHGCIRACVADAKWIYENCSGATIKIFDGTYSAQEVFKSPLGRRKLAYMSGDYDPTDPLGTSGEP